MKEVSCSWPIASLLGQYCESHNIPFKIVEDSKIDLGYFPLYYNDPVQGMCGKYLEKLSWSKPIDEYEGIKTYFITEVGSLEKPASFSAFMKDFAERYAAFKDDVLSLGEIMLAIGTEWKIFVENGYKILPKMTPHLLMFYNKNFFDYIDECQLPKELRAVFKSLFPKEDISFNNGAAYIVTQIFDAKCSLQLSKFLMAASTFKVMVDKDSNETTEDLLVLKVGQPEKVSGYVSFIGTCPSSQSTISYFGFDDLKAKGITQLMLAEHDGQVQIDVYHDGQLKDEELLAFIETFIDLSSYDDMVAHNSDYYPGNWAFSAKEAMTNPFKKGQDNLYHFGAAYFTAAMYEINELEGANTYVKNSD